MTLEVPASPEDRAPAILSGPDAATVAPDLAPLCPSCLGGAASPTIWHRYRSFFLAPNTIITVLCGVLLLAGAVVAWTLRLPVLANGLWAASALVGGAPIFLLAARGLAHRDLTAGVMVSVAMIGALLIGEFSAAALVAFMMMFGEILENFTTARADNALRALARLLPEQATVLRTDREILMPVSQLQAGDLVLVRNGGRIPVDGTIRLGHAAVDESAMTGEAIPIDKAPGDGVYAGTLNTAGTLQIETQRIGQSTALGTVVKLVAEAQRTQAPVQRLANRYAQYLVPITFGLAILTYLITGHALRAVTVLVVVCPCALVLATPTALVAAIANAARHQVVVKSGAALEALGNVAVIALDKTGTLTQGRPQVTGVVPLDSVPADDILRFAAEAERYSEHPLGRAIVRAAVQRGMQVGEAQDVTVLTGAGVRAASRGRRIVVGQPELLRASGVAIGPEQAAQLAALQRDGLTVVPVAVDERVAGLIALADAPRHEAPALVAALHDQGIKVVLISGDNAASVARVAQAVAADAVHAEVLPGQKLELIRGLQNRLRVDGDGAQHEGTSQPVGRPVRWPFSVARRAFRPRIPAVAYVGDGVNDAPALAAADVGIAMGAGGTDVAVQTAQMALLSDDLSRLPHLLALARETLRTVRICVAFSMSMNILALTLSMLGVIGPPAGALMHELSALPVLAYAARLVAFSRADRPAQPGA